jgi:excisionase family DNA binding protein
MGQATSTVFAVTMSDEVPSVKLLLTISEAAAAMSVGKTLLYELLLRKEIVSIKIGRSRRVLVASLRDYVAKQVQDEMNTP